MSTIYDVVNALLTACEYMHETDYMIKLCDELVFRTTCVRFRNICMPRPCEDDVAKIFSVLVLLYGDYGVNPESGWISEDNKQELIRAVGVYRKTLNKED